MYGTLSCVGIVRGFVINPVWSDFSVMPTICPIRKLNSVSTLIANSKEIQVCLFDDVQPEFISKQPAYCVPSERSPFSSLYVLIFLVSQIGLIVPVYKFIMTTLHVNICRFFLVLHRQYAIEAVHV